MTVDPLGRVSWATTAADIGKSHVVVAVDDGRGLSATQTFDVTVSADITPPSVEIQIGENPARLGHTVTFLVSATDDVGVCSGL